MSPFFKKRQRGFSLVELLVSLTVVGVILAFVVQNQNVYTETAALNNLADTIGITFAQAQAYGIAVRKSTQGSGTFSDAYGLSFSRLASGGDKSYIFFVDRDNTQHYSDDWSCAAESECLEKIDVPGGNFIEDFCIVKTLGSDQCSNVGRVDITFKRPDLDARIKTFNSSGQEYTTPNLKGVRIELQSPSGQQRSVTIYTTGQISVQ